MIRSISPKLATTLDLLASTSNEAAVPVLVWALDSPHSVIRDGAFQALLDRPSRQGYRELVARLHRFPFGWMERLREYGDQLRPALREAILSEDPQHRHNGCRAAVWLSQYEVIPTLLTALEEGKGANSEPVLAALYDLVEQLREQIRNPTQAFHRNLAALRTQVLATLEGSLERFSDHRRIEVLEAFLHLAPRDHPLLQQILQSPHHPLHLPLMEVLSKSRSPVIQELLLGYLEESQLPVGVITVFVKRSDSKFIRQFLRKIGRSQSPLLAQNLKRLRNISWLRGGAGVLQGFDTWAELGLVRLAVLSSIPRSVAFGLVEYILRYGKPAGRRAAAEALAEFRGAAANALALQALEDSDPYVQAAVVGHIRQRGIPGLLPRLLVLLDSPHAVLRQAVRKTLAELNFKRFLNSFDLLDEEVRVQTGLLVKKIDPQTIPLLRQELESSIRSRRLRAIAILRAIDAVKPLETILMRLAQEDQDPQIRREAATALAEGGIVFSPPAQPVAQPVAPITTVGAKPSGPALRPDPFTHYRKTLWDPRD